MTTGKTIALTRRTFVGKVMSLLFNMLCMLVITFLPRSKHLLISWLQSLSAVILEPKKIKSDTVSPSISHEVMGPDAVIFVFWMLSFKPLFQSPLWEQSNVYRRWPDSQILWSPWTKTTVHPAQTAIINITPISVEISFCHLKFCVSWQTIR